MLRSDAVHRFACDQLPDNPPSGASHLTAVHRFPCDRLSDNPPSGASNLTAVHLFPDGGNPSFYGDVLLGLVACRCGQLVRAVGSAV